MNPKPLYSGRNVSPAYALRYSWSAFTTQGSSPPSGTERAIEDLAVVWEKDGLRLLEHRVGEKKVQATFSCRADVAPMFLAARAKGRLQHALRMVGTPVKFARNFSVRSLGKNLPLRGRKAMASPLCP